MDLTKLSDFALLGHFKDEVRHPAHGTAFDEVLRRYERLIFHIARTYFKNNEDAKDATQDTAIKIYGNLQRVVISEEGSLKAWIATVTARTCLDALRKKRPQTVPLVVEQASGTEFSAEDMAVAKEKAEEILRAIKKLPNNHRMIIILRDMKGLSYEDLAKTLGINIGTVKSQLNRARLSLKKLLEAQGT